MQGGITPKALEHVIQSAHLNVQHASYSLMPAVTIFQGSIYDRLGQYSQVSGATPAACLRAVDLAAIFRSLQDHIALTTTCF